jgi:hypothetical protein
MNISIKVKKKKKKAIQIAIRQQEKVIEYRIYAPIQKDKLQYVSEVAAFSNGEDVFNVSRFLLSCMST